MGRINFRTKKLLDKSANVVLLQSVDVYFTDELDTSNFNESVPNLHTITSSTFSEDLLFDPECYFNETQKEFVQKNDIEKKRSRYILDIIQTANQREREQSFITDCKEARNRKLEEAKLGKSAKYTTLSYKRKIENDRKLFLTDQKNELKSKKN